MGTLGRWVGARAAQALAERMAAEQSLARAVTRSHAGMPVLVIAFNNGWYVANMVTQLNARQVTPLIIDNCSTDSRTRTILTSLAQDERAVVVRSSRNLGHLVGFLDPVYKLLPDTFAYTDPDLAFNPDMPCDFLSELERVANRFEVFKAGLALSLDAGPLRPLRSKTVRRYPFKFEKVHAIAEWERQFWTRRLTHESLEVYAAAVDTTMAVYRKPYFSGDFAQGVRVAGAYSAIHLPWFEDLDVATQEEQETYRRTNRFSAWLRNWVP